MTITTRATCRLSGERGILASTKPCIIYTVHTCLTGMKLSGELSPGIAQLTKSLFAQKSARPQCWPLGRGGNAMTSLRKSLPMGPLAFMFVVLMTVAFVTVVATPVGAQALGNAVESSAQPQVTFAKDVVPVLQTKCQECHHTGGMAPMSLVTYEETRPWARAMKQRVETRIMPPWHLDKTVGIQRFQNDLSLSEEQIATIVRWVDEGAPL